ncbi:MAG: hypothetical protein QOI74_2528 [Micromonosporaceae bacterium]|nr:hypothetical protein [Micromonosporaceae bacterium]
MHRKFAIPLIGTGVLILAAGTAIQVASAGESANFSAKYSQVESWGGGLIGTFTVSNPSAEAASDWKLSFGLPHGAKVTGVWNATLSAAGGTYTVKPIARSRTVLGHGSIEVGLTAAANTPVTPVNCTVNHKSCQIDAASTARIEAAAAPAQQGTSELNPAPADAQTTDGSTTGGPDAAVSDGAATSTPDRTVTTGFAPYVFLPAAGRPPLDVIAAGSGANGLTLSSLLPATSRGCDLLWGGTTALGTYANEITKALRLKVGVVASVGAGGGTDLAANCGTVAAVEAALNKVLDLGIRDLDITIPGGVLDDVTANTVLAKAIKGLQVRIHGLKVSYTIPAVTDGRANSLDVLAQPLAVAGTVGAVISRINILSVDRKSPVDVLGSLLGTAAPGDTVSTLIDTATGLHQKIMQIQGVDAATAWGALGVVPVLGGNDLLGRTTSLVGSVTKLVSFAKSNGLGLVSFLPLDVAGGCGSTGNGPALLPVPQLDCLDLNVLPHFFEISDIFGRVLR